MIRNWSWAGRIPSVIGDVTLEGANNALHDHIQQLLVAARMQLEALKRDPTDASTTNKWPSLRIGATLQATAPKLLFQSEVPVNTVLTQYAVGANGRTFLLVERAKAPLEAREPLHVVSNWQATLRR